MGRGGKRVGDLRDPLPPSPEEIMTYTCASLEEFTLSDLKWLINKIVINVDPKNLTREEALEVLIRNAL